MLALDTPDMGHDVDDLDKCEYLVPVRWLRDVPIENAFMKPGLFANQNTAARLRDTDTIARLEQHFGLASNVAQSLEQT